MRANYKQKLKQIPEFDSLQKPEQIQLIAKSILIDKIGCIDLDLVQLGKICFTKNDDTVFEYNKLRTILNDIILTMQDIVKIGDDSVQIWRIQAMCRSIGKNLDTDVNKLDVIIDFDMQLIDIVKRLINEPNRFYSEIKQSKVANKMTRVLGTEQIKNLSNKFKDIVSSLDADEILDFMTVQIYYVYNQCNEIIRFRDKYIAHTDYAKYKQEYNNGNYKVGTLNIGVYEAYVKNGILKKIRSIKELCTEIVVVYYILQRINCGTNWCDYNLLTNKKDAEVWGIADIANGNPVLYKCKHEKTGKYIVETSAKHIIKERIPRVSDLYTEYKKELS